MTILGIDIGYANVKVYTESKKIIFPSIVGTGETSQFSMSGQRSALQIKLDDKTYNVGESALFGQSRWTSRKETRDWYTTKEYKILLHAVLSELPYRDDITVVTGLPVSFFKQEKDREALRELFQQSHYIYRVGQPMLTVKVDKCIVAPQPIGTLADIGLDENGQIGLDENGQVTSIEIVTDHVGIIDIGGKTTNLLHAFKMADVDAETDSFNIGGWDAVRAMRDVIEELCPDAGFEDHEIAEGIKDGYVTYRGEQVDIQNQMDAILDPMADEIVSKAMSLWGGAARLKTILISGGGANLIGGRIRIKFPHGNVKIVEDSTFANARGYWKLGMLKAKQ